MTAIPAPTAATPPTRLINTTAPLAGGGDLTADRTHTIANFAGSNPGAVPTSPGGTANFLRADATWNTPPGTGVPTTRQVTTTAPLFGGGALSSDLNLGINTFAGSSNGVVPNSPGGTNIYLRGDGNWAAPTIPPDVSSGWYAQPSTATFATSVTFTVNADVRPLMSAGTLIRYWQLGSPWYGYCASVTYSAPNSTVTLASGTAIANSVITEWDISYGYPEDFPGQMPWTLTTFTGFASNPTGLADMFFAVGGWCCYSVRQQTAGTSNATTFTLGNLPFRAVNIAGGQWVNACVCDDNSAPIVATTPMMRVVAAGQVITVTTNGNLGGSLWTATGGKRLTSGTLWYPIR